MRAAFAKIDVITSFYQKRCGHLVESYTSSFLTVNEAIEQLVRQ